MENMNDKGEVESVMIHDPVAGLNWVLNPRERSALKTPMRRTPAERVTREEVVKRIERLDPETRQRIQEQVRVHAQAGAGPLRTERVQIASSLSAAFGDARWAAQATTKELGTREFNGVKAIGKLRSYEIPAGAIGNRNPIQVSTETWTAPDLQVTVYTKHIDPRNGEVEFRLENLKREEPAASLFAVPSDYTVKEPQAAAGNRAQ
jgi:hypothetical protein